MSPISGESPGPNLEFLNREAEAAGIERAAELRRTAIDLTYKMFCELWKTDYETERLLHDSGYFEHPQEHERPTQYLKLDLLAAPGDQVADVSKAISYLLVRTKPRTPGENFGADRIRILLPVDQDFKLGRDMSELPDLDEVGSVIVELQKFTANRKRIRRYEVSRETVVEYASLADRDRESLHDEIMDRRLNWMATDTQHLDLVMLAKLPEDHKNFRVVPQPYPDERDLTAN